MDRNSLLAELEAVCEALNNAGVVHVSVSFGWDANLGIKDMWKDQTVAVKDLCSFIALSEKSGVVVVGKGDILITAPDFSFILCHESDIHIDGESPLVRRVIRRWKDLGQAPYKVQQRG